LKDWLKHHWRNKWGQSNINFCDWKRSQCEKN
jgi:hypothetical protein